MIIKAGFGSSRSLSEMKLPFVIQEPELSGGASIGGGLQASDG
jgi:hypothetical protein